LHLVGILFPHIHRYQLPLLAHCDIVRYLFKTKNVQVQSVFHATK